MIKEFKEGQLILFKVDDTSFISRTISKVTKNEFTHVGIIKEIKCDHLIISEALSNGFVDNNYYIDELDYRISNNMWRVLDFKKKHKHNPEKIKEILEELKGKKYSYLQLLAILIRRYTGITIYENGEKRLICSEGAGIFCKKYLNIDLSKEFDKLMDYITPADISKSKHFKIISIDL